MTTELHSRRQQAQEDLGLINEKEQAKINNALQEEEQRRLNKEQRKIEIQQSFSYKTIQGISRIMDDYYIDPIIGFIFPAGIGDALPALLIIPYVYISLFIIHSIPLTLAVIYNTIKDILLGMIPFFIGDIIDIFNKGYKQNRKLIIGFVEDDREIINDVNRKAVGMAIGIIIVCVLIYFCIKWIIELGSWFLGLF